jgi:hypothetical protein
MPGDFIPDGPLGAYYVIPLSESTSVRRAVKALRFDVRSERPNIGSKQDSLNEWARAHGAAWGSPQRLRIELRARTKEPVVIHGLTVNVVRKAPPTPGWFATTAECGAPLVRRANVDLDATPPTITYAMGKPGDPEQHAMTLTVTDTDVEILDLWAVTRKADVEWTAELLYTGPDGPGRAKIDHGGKPFRVTTEVGSEGYVNFGNLERRTDWDSAGIIIC